MHFIGSVGEHFGARNRSICIATRLSAHHDRFALAAEREKERKRERGDRGSRREESATNK